MYDKSVRIIIFFLLLLIVAFLSLAGRCFYLQHFRSNHYWSICLKQQQAQKPQKPQRGVILDCRGRVLAASNKVQTIFAEPQVIKSPKSISIKLAPIVDLGAQEICEFITESKNPGFVKIKVGAEANQCSAASKIYGIGVQSDWQRYYPMGWLAGHIVGFTSVDNRGLGGIELQYDKELSGSSWQNIFFADAFRRPIRRSSLVAGRSSHMAGGTGGEPRDGCGIILTLDATIQQFARAELSKQYESVQAESAVAIVAEPETGAILAMVSLPDFDPGLRLAGSPDANNFRAPTVVFDKKTCGPRETRNRAITDQFEPGSLLKPIVAAIAIDAGVVGLDETIFCEEGHYRGRGFGRIGEYGNHRFGNLRVREILTFSSNIGMAKIGQKLGKDKLYNGLKLFGFGKKTGLDLPGEVQGQLRPVHKWTGYSVTRIPFGQEISVTAIQLVRAFCVLANGGRSVRPFLVKAMVGNDGKIIKLGPHFAKKTQNGNPVKRPPLYPGRIGFVVKPEVARWIVTDAMVGVINEGTGRKARLEKWQVFGKTGTANIAETDRRGYSDSHYVASFVAGAPADDPAVVVLVSIRKPNIKLGKGYTGGTIAAPVAARILEKTLNYLAVIGNR